MRRSRSFLANGVAVQRNFLSQKEVRELQPLVELALSMPRDQSCTRPNNTLVPLRWNDDIVQMFLASARRIEALSRLLDAEDLRWISAYVSIKEPHSPPLWWHQDWWCWDHPLSFEPEAAQIGVLCYLTETNSMNGALRVLPASHHKSAPIHALLPEAHGWHSGKELDANHIALRDLPDQKTLCLRAGDATVIDYRLLHGTHGNTTSVRRECVLLSFTPSWRRLPKDVRAHLISHPALPSQRETRTIPAWLATLLPRFNGVRSDLQLNRNAPASFNTLGKEHGNGNNSSER